MFGIPEEALPGLVRSLCGLIFFIILCHVSEEVTRVLKLLKTMQERQLQMDLKLDALKRRMK